MGAPADGSIVRGCGRRVAGGVYLECGMVSEGGVPLSRFLVDPPIPMTVDSKVGVEAVKRGETYHVLDHVGSQHYPHAADFIEEGRHHGFSRRIPANFDFSLLSKDSRIFVVHARGLVTNHLELLPFMDAALVTDDANLCALNANTGKHDHYGGGVNCIRDLWAVPPAVGHEERPSGVAYFREHGSTVYRVYPMMPDAPEPQFTSALVAAIPITNISVIRAPDGSHHEKAKRVRELVDYEGGITVTERNE